MDKSIGKLSLDIEINRSSLTEEVKREWQKAQTYADEHTIKYSFTGDKSDLEKIKKQIAGLNPNIEAGFQINLDKKDFENKLTLLKNSAGKEAKAIGKDFAEHINDSMKKVDIGSMLSGKNAFDSSEATEELKALARQFSKDTKNFNIVDAKSFSDVENYVVSLKKLEMILKELENRNVTDIKAPTAKKEINLADTLSGTTSQIESVMNEVGSIIKTNASSWTDILEQT